MMCALPALLVADFAYGDISLGRPAVPNITRNDAYHCDLLASNAVRAALKEIRSVPIVSLESATPTTAQIAIFEVKQNLRHCRYDRMGDGALSVGKLFPVSLSGDVPGQDAALADQIREMKPGDEAIMNIDHIYLFREEGNENVRSCTRFAKARPQGEMPPPPPSAQLPGVASPDSQTQQPAATPQPSVRVSSGFTGRSVESRVTVEPDGKGGSVRKKVEIHREWTADGKQQVRKFINDVEVNPDTDQPLPLSAPQSEAAPAPAPAPAPAGGDDLPPIPEPPAELGAEA